MFPQRMSSLAFRSDDSHCDQAHALEQHVLAGFSPDLALDLVLNDLVMRAAEATHANAAVLALVRGDERGDVRGDNRSNERGDELICRAATGHLAPGPGIPLNPREDLSGVCLHTHQAQFSVDTELDPRVDASTSRRLGIRSILIVPVFDTNDHDTSDNDRNANDTNNHSRFVGVLEVFSSSAAAFSDFEHKVLEGFAEECARICHVALKLSQRKPVAVSSTVRILPAFDTADLTPSDLTATAPSPARRLAYQAWTIALGALTVLATIAVSLLIGSRIGWLGTSESHVPTSQIIPAETRAPQESCVGTAVPGCPAEQGSAATIADHRTDQLSEDQSSEDRSSEGRSPENVSARGRERRAREKGEEKAREKTAKKSSASPADSAENDLVVYEKGKVIFRLKSAPTKADAANDNRAKPNPDPVVLAASTTKLAGANNSATKLAATKTAPISGVWLSPDQAEDLLQSRTEPTYPTEALAAHRAGNVVLDVQVGEDGSVSNIRTLSGDPLLAAAAIAAVRNWRYQPYRLHDHPSQFQTDVTLTFTLPN